MYAESAFYCVLRFHCLTVMIQEEMSDLRALIRLKEKELRCLEWSLMAHKAQEAAGILPESLPEELEDHKTEQQVGQTLHTAFFLFSNNTKSR